MGNLEYAAIAMVIVVSTTISIITTVETTIIITIILNCILIKENATKKNENNNRDSQRKKMKIVGKNENKNENNSWDSHNCQVKNILILWRKYEFKIGARYRVDNWGRPTSVGTNQNHAYIRKSIRYYQRYIAFL